MRLSRETILFALCLASQFAEAGVYPPLQSQLRLPTITVLDENDHPIVLPLAFDKQKEPFFLLPVFTKCKMSCPIIVPALVDALEAYRKDGGSQNYRVLIFSFDSTDTAADLRVFRTKYKIPTFWQMVRSPDQSAVRGFFDQFSYSIMSVDSGGFAHPNEIFVLNGRLIWVGSLFGSSFSKNDISNAFYLAGDSGLWSQFRNWIFHPESLIVIGALGFLGCLALLLGWIWKRADQKLSI